MIAIIPCEHCGSLNGMPVGSLACIDCGKEREHHPSVSELKAEIAGLNTKIDDFPCCGKCDSVRLAKAAVALRAVLDSWAEYRFRCSDTPGATAGLDRRLYANDDATMKALKETEWLSGYAVPVVPT